MTQRTQSDLTLDGLNILLVEDDPYVRETVAALMEEEGAHVTALDAAEPALSALAAHGAGYDLLFTDILLGGPLSGYDVATAALAADRPPGIVLASGYAAPAGNLPAALEKVARMLAKPFRRGDMLAAISAVCLPRRGAF